MRVSTLFHATLLALSSRGAVASGATIVAALNNVNTVTQSLDDTVQSWSGDLFGSFPIVSKSADVLEAISDGKDAAENSAPLTNDEALGIATAVQTLAKTVNSTMTDIIAAHDDFKHLLLAPIVLLDLKTQKSHSDDMSNAIIAKVPTALQPIAKNLAAPIDDSFAQAIAVFSLSNGI